MEWNILGEKDGEVKARAALFWYMGGGEEEGGGCGGCVGRQFTP